MDESDNVGVVQITVQITEQAHALPSTGADPTVLILLGVITVLLGVALTWVRQPAFALGQHPLAHSQKGRSRRQ